LISVFFVIASTAAANVIVGSPAESGNGNCIPFGCDVSFGITQYQQLYSASDFSGVLNITGLTFFDTQDAGAGSSLDNGTFTVSLSTISTSLSSFTGIVPLGSNHTQIFSGTLPTLTAGGSITLGGGGSFSYDPSAGNLLVNITITGATTDGTAFLDVRNGDATGIFGRETNGSNGGTTGYGLVTQFQTGASSAPEPSTFLLMGSLAFVLLLARRVPFLGLRKN
jgi:hypothetical protein